MMNTIIHTVISTAIHAIRDYIEIVDKCIETSSVSLTHEHTRIQE